MAHMLFYLVDIIVIVVKNSIDFLSKDKSAVMHAKANKVDPSRLHFVRGGRVASRSRNSDVVEKRRLKSLS